MSTPITYKHATVEDVNTFFSFFKKSLEQYFNHYTKNTLSYFIEQDYSQSYITKSIDMGKMELYLALSQSALIGYILSSKTYGGVAFANWIAVDAEFRNQGIASNLLKIWQKTVLEAGAHKLQIWTTEDNVAFYTHRGFIEVGKIPDNYFGSNDVLLYKTLQPSNELMFLQSFIKPKPKKNS